MAAVERHGDAARLAGRLEAPAVADAHVAAGALEHVVQLVREVPPARRPLCSGPPATLTPCTRCRGLPAPRDRH